MEKARVKVEKLFRKYDSERKELAALPFEEKIRIVVELQKRAAALRPELKRTVWNLDEEKSKK